MSMATGEAIGEAMGVIGPGIILGGQAELVHAGFATSFQWSLTTGTPKHW